MMEEPVLRIDHLTVRYGKTCEYCRNGGALDKNTCPHCRTVWACNDVNVELYEGEILGIVGESGSGKSTLMKSLYFDFGITEGQGYLRDYKDGKEDIFCTEPAPEKIYQKPYHGHGLSESGAGTADGLFQRTAILPKSSLLRAIETMEI